MPQNDQARQVYTGSGPRWTDRSTQYDTVQQEHHTYPAASVF